MWVMGITNSEREPSHQKHSFIPGHQVGLSDSGGTLGWKGEPYQTEDRISQS